jgi:hypothetical protein
LALSRFELILASEILRSHEAQVSVSRYWKVFLNAVLGSPIPTAVAEMVVALFLYRASPSLPSLK